VVQVAAITMQGGAILESPRLETLVNPGVPVPPSASAIHGLDDRKLAGAPAFADVALELLARFDGRVVVGHHIGFDLAILREESARAGVAWKDPLFLDVALLAAALEPSLPDQGLETVAGWLGVEIRGRHSAPGDALAAAQVFAALIARMRGADVRTLGEAQMLAERRPDLLRRQHAAGWLLAPGGSGREAARPERIDRFIFERRLRDVMSSPPLGVPREATLRDAARLMSERRIGALLIGKPGEPPQGIVTERDLLRASADGHRDPDIAQVGSVMSSPVHVMRADEMLYRALGRMDRVGMRHLCVVDDRGVAVGMVSQRDLLHHRARRSFVIGDAIAAAADGPSLASAYARLPEVAAALLHEGVAGVEIAQVISEELRGLSARAAEIVAARLEAAGSPAPAPWCLLVLGSGGRGESLLGADQDNALIHGGQASEGEWFARMGEELARLLDEAGIPRCRGGVMAANAAWRGTLLSWPGRVEEWLGRATPQDLLNADIFFDLAPVAGDAAMGRALQESALAVASRVPSFIALLAESVVASRPAIGPFGVKAREGRVDLKMGGLLPLVGFARALALRVGSPARATPERLRAAVQAGRLPEADARDLMRIHANLLSLVLRQQLADLEQGLRPSGRVSKAMVGGEGWRALASDLRHLDEILQGLRGAVSG
jgi:DNA polymerase-3 subunit epsilon/CBS domain-containing protein